MPSIVNSLTSCRHAFIGKLRKLFFLIFTMIFYGKKCFIHLILYVFLRNPLSHPFLEKHVQQMHLSSFLLMMSFPPYFFISICNVRPHCVKEVKQRNPFTATTTVQQHKSSPGKKKPSRVLSSDLQCC